jgi:hypothetical protein
MNRFVFLFLSVAVLTSCATTANYEAVLNSWIGAPADRLVASWGPPESEYKLSDGGKVLVYSRERTVQTGGYTQTRRVPKTTYTTGTVSAYGSGGGYANANYDQTSTTYETQTRTTPVRTYTKTCKTRFTTDWLGYIKYWAWEGNDCAALPRK